MQIGSLIARSPTRVVDVTGEYLIVLRPATLPIAKLCNTSKVLKSPSSYILLVESPLSSILLAPILV